MLWFMNFFTSVRQKKVQDNINGECLFTSVRQIKAQDNINGECLANPCIFCGKT
jgi:hypothetical protein